MEGIKMKNFIKGFTFGTIVTLIFHFLWIWKGEC